MKYTKKSRLREVYRHPVGHDILLALARHLGKENDWAKAGRGGAMQLAALDRLAGKGFADTLLEMLNQTAQHAPLPGDEAEHWWKEGVVYHLFIPSFMDADHDGVGDIEGVRQRLPYLEGLGITVIWLWPLLDAVSVGERGVSDFKKVLPEMGTMQDFEALVTDAHSRGMRVMVGMDFSSTSERHEWFQKALAGDEGYRDYYIFRKGSATTPPNNWGRVLSGPAWNWYEELGAWGLRLMGRHRVDLNWDNPAVRDEMAQVIKFWRDKGVDGFVLGAANLISKEGYGDGNPAMGSVTGLRGFEHFAFGPHLAQYLEQTRTAALDGDAMVMGDIKNLGPEMAACVAGDGKHLDMVLDVTHLSIRKRGPREQSTLTVADIKQYYMTWMEHHGAQRWLPLLLETPEHPRIVSRLGASPVYRSILAKMLAMMMFTLRGTPVVYQGQELGLVNTHFKSIQELRHQVTLRKYQELCGRIGESAAFQWVLDYTADHARTPMPWSPGPGGGFTGAQPWIRLADGVDYLNVSNQMQDEKSVWWFYQTLIALRKENAVLVYGSFNPVFAKNDKLFCYFRILDGKKWYVEMNITEKEIKRPARILPTQELVLSNYETQAQTLRPYEANLYRCE